jgi:N-acyl-D-amino-acid deacylase
MRSIGVIQRRIVALSTVLALAVAPTARAQTGARQSSVPSVLIRGGTVLDGTGQNVARLADVRVTGDVITEIAPRLTPRTGERVIDATGLTVSPGFIDLHSHADRGLERADLMESQVRQGITTAVVGQDGESDLPVSDFFDQVEHVHPAINFATMIGHGTVRGAVLGGDYRRPATPREIETMRSLVERGMRDGAVGVSSGTEYDPGYYATPGEIQALVAAVKPYGGYYASHVRDEENKVLDAWREVIDVGRATGARVHISHAKLASKPVWGQAAAALALIDSARRSGVAVTADWYPYTYWSSSIYVLIPDRDFENRKEWEVGLDEIGGADNVLITSFAPDSSRNGKTVGEIARLEGKDPVTVIIEMIRAAGPNIGIIATAMTEPDLGAIFAHPAVMICSDGSPVGAHPHPRAFGTFPRVLGTYVRERKIVPLSQTIAKMTRESARLLGFSDRGVLVPGKKADIVVFDPATVADRGTKTDPKRAPVGIEYVIVNGEVVLDHGAMTDARPGRALRRQGWQPYPVSTAR